MKFYKRILTVMAIIGIGDYILGKSFDMYGRKKYNSISIWGDEDEKS